MGLGKLFESHKFNEDLVEEDEREWTGNAVNEDEKSNRLESRDSPHYNIRHIISRSAQTSSFPLTRYNVCLHRRQGILSSLQSLLTSALVYGQRGEAKKMRLG